MSATTATSSPSGAEGIRYIDELRGFLRSRQQHVLLLHGNWGTGKTYFWRHFIDAEVAQLQEAFYSYVSLFGASSVAHVRSLILFGGKPARPADDLPSLARRIRNIVASKRRYLPRISLPHIGDIGSAIGTFDELLIKNYLVCFDDLERRNKQLDLEQLLGLVALLKEQNQCKVVIICNENELSKEDAEVLNKYREKIVDRQLTYAPPFEQNFRIVFADGNGPVRDVFAAVRINNIRVFQQTRWCVEYFEPYLRHCASAFIDKFTEQCAKLACVHLALSKEISIEQLRSTSWLASRSPEETDLSETAKDIVTNLQFLPLDSDDFVIHYLRNGFCDTAALESTVKKLNDKHQRGEADQALTDIWGKIWHNYQASVDDVVAAVEEYLARYSTLIPFKYGSDLADFVKRIAPAFDADAKKDALAKALIPTADVTTLRVIQQSGSAVASSEAKLREQQIKSRKSIGQLIQLLGASNGWSPGNFSELNEYTDEELFAWLSEASEPYLLSTIAEVVARGQLESADSTGGRQIGTKFRGVFDRMKNRNPLDGERTAHFYALLRRNLKQYGREAPEDICPPEPPPTEQTAS